MIFIFLVLSLTGIGQGFKITRPSKFDTSFFPRQNWNFIRELQDDRVNIPYNFKNQPKDIFILFIYVRTMCCLLLSCQPRP